MLAGLYHIEFASISIGALRGAQTTGSSLYINNNTLFFDLNDNKVVYWKDVEDNSVENVALKASMNANTVGVAAFVNDAYKNISNSLACNNPTFDPSNPQDIFINVTTANVAGNKLIAIKNGTASLNSNDYSISGNTVTIKKSYLSYFFNKFTAPWQKLTLTFDFDKCNDPIFMVARSSSNLTSFIGMIKAVRIQGQAVTLVKDVNGISTEADYSVKVDSNDFNLGSTSAGAVSAPITWDNFVTNDMQGIAGDKTSTNDPQHRIYKFYINDDNRIVRIERINFGSNITPTKFNTDTDKIETSNGSVYIDSTIFFDLKDNKVRYWKDIEGKSASKVVLQASMKPNGVDSDVVAFVNDTYKYVEGGDTFYAYIKDEYFSDPYYTLITGIGDTLKVNKDDIYQFKQIDKQFISYTKDGDKSKIKTVTKAVYNSGYISPLVVQNDTIDSSSTVYTAYGTFGCKDGSTINVYSQGGTDLNGGALTAGTMYSFKLDPQVKVTKLTFKDSGDIDTASIQDATDIVNGDKVGLVIIDGSVRMIYYKR